MTKLECHELIAKCHHSDPEGMECLIPTGLELSPVDGIDATVAVLTALVVLSGMLAETESIEETIEAICHGASLFRSEVFTYKELINETTDIAAELLRWGDKEMA